MAAQMEDFDAQRIEEGRTAVDEEELVYVEGEQQLEGDEAGECRSLPDCLPLFFWGKIHVLTLSYSS